MSTRFMRPALALVLALVVGCGGRPDVAGSVAHKGKKVTGGLLVFSPLDGGKPATAEVHENGTFSLVKGPRARAGPGTGRYKVGYSAPVLPFPDGKEPKNEGDAPPPSGYEGLVPKPDEVEIKAGNNSFTFELVPAPPKRR